MSTKPQAQPFCDENQRITATLFSRQNSLILDSHLTVPCFPPPPIPDSCHARAPGSNPPQVSVKLDNDENMNKSHSFFAFGNSPAMPSEEFEDVLIIQLKNDRKLKLFSSNAVNKF